MRAHHGSVSHEQRAAIEEALKAGDVRGIVATSSLELGIDMGAVDQVVLVESPGAVARGLQRVGRAGHRVGEVSRGDIFPKFRGDLLECAVIVDRMRRAARSSRLAVPRNPLDVLAQQLVAMCCDRDRDGRGAERCRPARLSVSRALGRSIARGARDALRPVSLGRLRGSAGTLELGSERGSAASARKGTPMVSRLNAGTIPDRGNYAVHLGNGRAEGGRARRGDGVRDPRRRERDARCQYLAGGEHRSRPRDRGPLPRASPAGCRSGAATARAGRSSSGARSAPSPVSSER